MREIILPIKPCYVEKILKGEKRVEYRCWTPVCECPFKVYIYSSGKVRKIVGSFIVKEILTDSTEKIWENTNKVGGIDKESFFDYFNSSKNPYMANAFVISDLDIFEKPRELADFGVTSTIQRFTYYK